MRKTLRQAVVSLGLFGDRVYEMQVPSKDTQKPYCVIRFLSDAQDSEWLGYRRTIEIYPYLARTSFSELDNIAKSLIQGLDKQLIIDEGTNEAFTCLYRGSRQDFVDDDWDAITRVLTFDVLALRYVEQVDTSQDAWVSNIIHTLNENLSGYSVYSGSLPQEYSFPCVLVRATSNKIKRLGKNITQETKTFKIHLFTSNRQEKEIALGVVLGLFKVGDKVLLKDSYYSVDSVVAINDIDPFTDGQITIDLSRITIAQDEGTKISTVYNRGGINE